MPPEGDHAQTLGNRRQPAAIKIACSRNNRGNCSPSVRRESSYRRRRFPAQRESRKKPPAQRAGRGGDPRKAGAPQQARISPAKREDARRLAPCGERWTGNATCDSDALRHTDKGSTGVVGGVEGFAPLTPCRQPRRLPHPDAGLKPPASGKKIACMP